LHSKAVLGCDVVGMFYWIRKLVAPNQDVISSA
jgi:hypothetical protein